MLRVLGVVKVATADQIQRLTRPHLTFRHPSGAGGRRSKTHRNAALDLAGHGYVRSEGHTPQREKLWGLTPAGLAAAAGVLDRPAGEMGGIARGAGVHGAAHARAVTEAILALSRPRPAGLYYAQLAPADQACVDAMAEGIGVLEGWSTEVALPAAGTWNKPGRGSAQADAVLTAPEDGLPVVFVEVDRGTMPPEQIAQKFDRYRRFFERTVNDPAGPVPWWSTRWQQGPQEGFPPVLVVFTGRGERSLFQRAQKTFALAGHHSLGERGAGAAWTDYRRTIPLLGTTLERLKERGPWGQAWWRADGEGVPQTLTGALHPPDGYHAYLRRRERAQR
ncbi:replication-relaxation family protein [Streptomyces sp. NPDC058268]|uniref:replication-relaxation family protein n=1 Tax=Streptomyces sp. NPDC058268 TaxID=3346413 RepID=UPI0036E59E5F